MAASDVFSNEFIKLLLNCSRFEWGKIIVNVKNNEIKLNCCNVYFAHTHTHAHMYVHLLTHVFK